MLAFTLIKKRSPIKRHLLREMASDLYPLFFGISYFGKREDKLVKHKDSTPELSFCGLT